MSLRSRNNRAGLLGGFFGAANSRRNKAEARMQYLADNKALQQQETAKSQYEANMKGAKTEQLQVAQLTNQGHVQKDEQGNLAFTTEYWREKAFADSGLKRVEFEEADYMEDGSTGKLTQRAMGTKAKFFQRQYKDLKHYDQNHANNLAAISEQQVTAGSQRAQPSALGQMLSGGSPEEEAAKLANASAGAQLTSVGAPTQNAQEFNVSTDPQFAPEGQKSKERKNLKAVSVQGKDGLFYMDPTTNEIRGPGTNGWVSAENLQTLPEDRAPLTVSYTDKNTNEEMKATLIETWAGDPLSVMSRGGKHFAPVSTPVKLRGTQDQHGPKSLSAAQNKDLGKRDSAFNVQSLSTEMLNQDYQGNPAGWVAARMSTITDMFSSVVPGLQGDEGDLESIISYIKSNVSEDAKANQELGVLDARAVAEGNVVAINKLLSYGTALWMNGGTRITTRVSEDAAEISEAWITGTAQHKGKLASLRNQASKSYSRTAARHLNFARQDNESTMWSQYPTARKKHGQGWDFATDKAEGYAMQQQLNQLKKSDPKAYKLSMDSLNGTMSSYDTLDTPIFWSAKYNTNVMIYHKTDPKTGAIRFATFKTE